MIILPYISIEKLPKAKQDQPERLATKTLRKNDH